MKKSDQINIIELYENAQQHEEPVLKVDMHGAKRWWLNGVRHRLDGPAVEYTDGTKFWYQNGKRHRIDGPAAEWTDGIKWWFVDDVKYDDVYEWAKAALEYQNLPTDSGAVKQYVHKILNKIADEDV